MNIHKLLGEKFKGRLYSCRGEYPNHVIDYHDGLPEITEAELEAANIEMIAEEPLCECRCKRSMAYADLGEQMGMLYDELLAKGVISLDGELSKHIEAVKTMYPKPGE